MQRQVDEISAVQCRQRSATKSATSKEATARLCARRSQQPRLRGHGQSRLRAGPRNTVGSCVWDGIEPSGPRVLDRLWFPSVEEHVLCSAFLHDPVCLERTWAQKLFPGLMSGQLNLAITGLLLLTVFTIHLFLFRFADTEPRTLRSPPTLTNWYTSWLITLNFFWTDIIHVSWVPDRDIFVNGYEVLKNSVWCGFYIMMDIFFVTHAAEFDMTLPSDVVEKYALDPVIGALGNGREADDEENDFSQGGCTMEEVVLKNPVWCSFYIMAVVIFMTHAAEFDMTLPADVVGKYALDPVIGALGDGREGDDEENDFSEGGCTMEEVVKYTRKHDVWVVLGLLVLASWRRVDNRWEGCLNRVRHDPPS